MADVPWGLLIFLVGIAYGYFAKGRQDKSQIFKSALLWGLVLGLVLVILGWLTGSAPLLLGAILGLVGFVISVAVLALLFILGVWLGDVIEGRTGGGPTRS